MGLLILILDARQADLDLVKINFAVEFFQDSAMWQLCELLGSKHL